MLEELLGRTEMSEINSSDFKVVTGVCAHVCKSCGTKLAYTVSEDGTVGEITGEILCPMAASAVMQLRLQGSNLGSVQEFANWSVGEIIVGEEAEKILASFPPIPEDITDIPSLFGELLSGKNEPTTEQLQDFMEHSDFPEQFHVTIKASYKGMANLTRTKIGCSDNLQLVKAIRMSDGENFEIGSIEVIQEDHDGKLLKFEKIERGGNSFELIFQDLRTVSQTAQEVLDGLREHVLQSLKIDEQLPKKYLKLIEAELGEHFWQGSGVIMLDLEDAKFGLLSSTFSIVGKNDLEFKHIEFKVLLDNPKDKLVMLKCGNSPDDLFSFKLLSYTPNGSKKQQPVFLSGLMDLLKTLSV
jgi:hypothetical protein